MIYGIVLGLLLAVPTPIRASAPGSTSTSTSAQAPAPRPDDISALVARYFTWRGGRAYVFKQLVVDIDFNERTIAFHEPESFEAPAGAVTVPLEEIGGRRTVPVRIEDGPEVRVDFDLGNGGPLLIFPSYWQSHQMTEDRLTSTRMGGAVGGMREEKLISVKSLTFAGHIFHDVPADLSLPGANAVDSDRSFGNVGMPVYSRFHY